MRPCKEYAPERGKDLSRAEAQAETQTPKSLSGCRGSGHDLPSCTSHGFAVQAMKQKARQARVKPHLACRSEPHAGAHPGSFAWLKAVQCFRPLLQDGLLAQMCRPR